jgi:hypothetical protein
MPHVLFVCLRNAGRSQMSQALFERAAAGRHTASSAGTTPAERIHPERAGSEPHPARPPLVTLHRRHVVDTQTPPPPLKWT